MLRFSSAVGGLTIGITCGLVFDDLGTVLITAVILGVLWGAICAVFKLP